MMQLPTEYQERWGAAITLLSLDVVMPFYPYMGLEIPDPHPLLEILRKSIIENRKIFELNQNQIPDLKNLVLKDLTDHFGFELAHIIEHWVDNVFVFTGQDFEPFNQWYLLFALARTDQNRWEMLGFPKELSKVTHETLEKVFDRTELHALADQISERPLSNWDLEMYAIHGFDDDDNDPYNWVLETVKKRRFLSYLKWLLSRLSEDARQQLVKNANDLKMRIETIRDFQSLTNPEKLLLKHA